MLLQPTPDKALQRMRLSHGSFPWRSVCAAELSRYATVNDRTRASAP